MSATLVQGPLIQTDTSGGLASVAKAFSSNVTAGNSILVVARLGGLTPPSSGYGITVTDSLSNTYQLAVASLAASTDDTKTEIYYSDNVVGGACTVTATLTGSPNRAQIQIFEVSGLDQTDSKEATNRATATSASPSAGTVAPAGAAFLIAHVQSSDGYITVTPGSGWTDTGAGAIGFWNKVTTEYRNEAASGTFAGDASFSVSKNYTAVIAAFKAAAGGGTILPLVAVDMANIADMKGMRG